MSECCKMISSRCLFPWLLRTTADMLTVKGSSKNPLRKRIAFQNILRENGIQVFRLAEFPLVRELFQLQPSLPAFRSISICKVHGLGGVHGHPAALDSRLFTWDIQRAQHPLIVTFCLWNWASGVPTDVDVEAEHVEKQFGMEAGRRICLPCRLIWVRFDARVRMFQVRTLKTSIPRKTLLPCSASFGSVICTTRRKISTAAK